MEGHVQGLGWQFDGPSKEATPKGLLKPSWLMICRRSIFTLDFRKAILTPRPADRQLDGALPREFGNSYRRQLCITGCAPVLCSICGDRIRVTSAIILKSRPNAAAQYIKAIYNTDAQASGLLVMASYNWGERRVNRLIKTMPENPQERNFWLLLDKYKKQIPRQTYDYVFHIFSAAVIGEDPHLFGFDFENPLALPRGTQP